MWNLSLPPFEISGVDAECWRQLKYVMIHLVHQKLRKISILHSSVFMADRPLSTSPLKIWILHLCGTNSISASNKPNEYIYGTLQCSPHHQRGKHLTLVVVFFQSWISCCLDHLVLVFIRMQPGRLVKASWLELLREPFICFSWMFNATRPTGA